MKVAIFIAILLLLWLSCKQKEYGLLGALGIGKHQKDEKVNTINSITSMVHKSLISNTQNCSASSSMDQDMEIHCEATPAGLAYTAQMYDTCMKYAVGEKEKESCNQTKYLCVVDGASQDANLTLKQNCVSKSNLQASMQQDVQSKLDQAMKEKSDAFGKALDSLFSNTDKSVKNTTTIKNVSKDIVDEKFVSNLVAHLESNQKMNISGSDMKVQGASQNATMNMISTQLESNGTVQKIAQKASDISSQKQEATLTGLTDIVGSVTGMIGSLGKAYIYAMVLCAVVFAIICMYAMYSGFASEAVQTTATLAPMAMGVPI